MEFRCRLKLNDKVFTVCGVKVCVSPKFKFWLRTEMFRVRPGKFPTDSEREELKK